MKTSIYSSLASALLVAVAVSSVFASDGGKGTNSGKPTQVRLRTDLAGAAIAGKKPAGKADVRMDPSRSQIDVEVEDVNLAAGTVLTVAVVHGGVSTIVGTITLSSTAENELNLESQHGDVVPAVVSGDMITVSNGATVILAGVF